MARALGLILNCHRVSKTSFYEQKSSARSNIVQPFMPFSVPYAEKFMFNYHKCSLILSAGGREDFRKLSVNGLTFLTDS